MTTRKVPEREAEAINARRLDPVAPTLDPIDIDSVVAWVEHPHVAHHPFAREVLRALVAEVRRLRGMVQGLADRVAAQSEILSRRAEKAGINHDTGGEVMMCTTMLANKT